MHSEQAGWVLGKSVDPTPQVLCSPGVPKVAREDCDVVRQNTSPHSDTAAAAIGMSMSPREVQEMRAGGCIPGLAGFLAAWGPCCHELWSLLDLRPSLARRSLRCGSSSRGRGE